MLQSCHARGCQAVPLTEIGSLAETKARDRQAAAAESRTVQLEVQGADRAVEVEGRREQQRAVAEETRRLTPPLVSS